MATKTGISGTGLAALAVGSILLWSAMKGRQWSDVVRELVGGEMPSSAPDYPIDVPSAGNVGNPADGTSGSSAGFERAEASSYWGVQTASGKRMTATTIASPYLPLNTIVQIKYKGKSAQGVVEDFGPADWVMAVNPDRFLDIAEPMMEQLTGKRGNVIQVEYRVIAYGRGRVYRPNAAKTAELKKRWTAS